MEAKVIGWKRVARHLNETSLEKAQILNRPNELGQLPKNSYQPQNVGFGYFWYNWKRSCTIWNKKHTLQCKFTFIQMLLWMQINDIQPGFSQIMIVCPSRTSTKRHLWWTTTITKHLILHPVTCPSILRAQNAGSGTDRCRVMSMFPPAWTCAQTTPPQPPKKRKKNHGVL